MALGAPAGTSERPRARLSAIDLLVGAVALGFHIAVRNYSASDINAGVVALDLGYVMDVVARIAEGGRAYTEVECHYGPYWLWYFLGFVKTLGVSIGSVRWALAFLAWGNSVTAYLLTSRLVGRGWGLLALVFAGASPVVRTGIPYPSHMTAPLVVLLMAAVYGALVAADARPRWCAVGALLGVILGVRWSTAFVGVAAVAMAAAASGRVHLPLRRGHLVGTVLIPLALIASEWLLLRQYSLTLWLSFGPPALACALLTGVESWRRRGSGPTSWRQWAHLPAYCTLGFLAATLVWLIPLTLERGLVAAVYDPFFRALEMYQLGAYHVVSEYLTKTILLGPPKIWPAPEVGYSLAFVVLGVCLHWRSRMSFRWPVTGMCMIVGVLLFATAMVRRGAAAAVVIGDAFWLWGVAWLYTAWCVHRVFGARSASPRPSWLAPLACFAGAMLADGAPGGDWIHVGSAIGPLIVIGVVLARDAWRVPTVGRAAWRAGLLALGGLAAATCLLALLGLWCALPVKSWRIVPRDLMWLDLPRGQVWDGAESARELTANAQVIQTLLDPAAPCFSFPDPLYLYLADRPPLTPVTYLLPGYLYPGADADIAKLLRERPPPLAIARFNPLGLHDNVHFLALGFPAVIETLEEDFVLIRQIGLIRYYRPRKPAPARAAP